MADDELEIAERKRMELVAVIDSLLKPWIDLRESAGLLGKKNSSSYKNAGNAYKSALDAHKDDLLRAKALRAFSECFSDMGLDEQASEMTKKWQKLAQNALAK